MPTSTITSKGQTTVPKNRWEGIFKDGPTDAVEAVAEARKRRGRV